MIRRLFWLSLGAALGVSGYRRATALARSLAPGTGRRGGPAPASRVAADRPAPALWRTRAVVRFAVDVRDGMGLYMERHQPPAPNTLEGQQAHAARPAAGAGGGRHTDQVEDGR